MKCLLINLIVFATAVNSGTSKHLFLPKLPFGEYRLNFLGILRCESIQTNDRIKFNYYLSKTSSNTTEIKGNLTFLVPLNDSLNVEVNMAVKDSIGGWKDNAHLFKTPNACSSIKMLAGNDWTSVSKSLGIPHANCPIPVGCYKALGLKNDKTIFSNLPKEFFYGTYKLRFQFTKKKVVYGCVVSVIEVKRPWETD